MGMYVNAMKTLRDTDLLTSGAVHSNRWPGDEKEQLSRGHTLPSRKGFDALRSMQFWPRLPTAAER